MKWRPIFPILSEEFSFGEEFAAGNRGNSRQTLRDHERDHTVGG
jgi:hypothetical protein